MPSLTKRHITWYVVSWNWTTPDNHRVWSEIAAPDVPRLNATVQGIITGCPNLHSLHIGTLSSSGMAAQRVSSDELATISKLPHGDGL